MDMPTVQQLQYAVALAGTKHFGRAAQLCHISQPALSAQIKKLEKTLGTPIFERSARRVSLTPRGREILTHAYAVLDATKTLVSVARGEVEPLSGTLHLGVIPTVAPYVLPKLLPEVRHRFTDLRLFLREDQTARLVEALRTNRLDVLLLALPLNEPGITEHPVFADPFWVATPPEHPLAGAKPISQKALRDQEVLLLEEGHCLRDHALEVCREGGAIESAMTRATSLGTLVQMVANGIGITLLPEIAVSVEARDPNQIVVRRFQNPQPSRTIGLAWRASALATDVEDYKLLAELLSGLAVNPAPDPTAHGVAVTPR